MNLYNNFLAARFTEKQRLELTPNHKNSIHLWQFLAELLNQEKWKCIKWLQREQGIIFLISLSYPRGRFLPHPF